MHAHTHAHKSVLFPLNLLYLQANMQRQPPTPTEAVDEVERRPPKALLYISTPPNGALAFFFALQCTSEV